jgi:ABC-type sugar transport system ATPase subunit
MVGREMSQRYLEIDHHPGNVLFEVRNWTVGDPELSGKNRLENVNFVLHEGEILGIAGLMGAGRTELAMSIIGSYGTNISGELYLRGQRIFNKQPNDAIRNHICYLSEDRKGNGLVLGMDVKANISLPNLRNITVLFSINENEEIHIAEKYVQDLRIKTPSIEQKVNNLSGGNQQKVVVGKWLMANPTVLILDEPTRGIDVSTKYEIYLIMNELVKSGVAIIMISSELPEILGMSDRILVMNEGKITSEFSRGEATSEKIMQNAIGSRRNG